MNDLDQHLQILRDDVIELEAALLGVVDARIARRCSAVLRRQLIEGRFAHTVSSLLRKGKPVIPAPDLDQELDNPLQGTRIVFAQAGGANIQLVDARIQFTRNVYIQSDRPAGEIHEERLGRCLPMLRDYTVDGYIRSTAIATMGRRISRGEIIKFVANKLGGVHLDTKHDPELVHIVRLMNHQIAPRICELHNLDILYYELMSIAFWFLSSPSMPFVPTRLEEINSLASRNAKPS